MKRALVTAIALFMLLPLTAFAARSGPVSIDEAYSWNSVIAPNDRLYVARINLNSDGEERRDGSNVIIPCADASDWDNCSPGDGFVSLIAGDNVERIRSAPYIGKSIVAFYLNASQVEALSGNEEMRVFASPTIFSDPLASVRDVEDRSRNTRQATLEDLEDKTVDMISNIDSTFVEGGEVTEEGLPYITAASTILQDLVTSQLQLSVRNIVGDVGDSTGTQLREVADRGDRTITVDNAAPFRVGDAIVINNLEGAEERHSINRIPSANVLEISGELVRAYPSGSVVYRTTLGNKPANETASSAFGEFGADGWVGGFVLTFLLVAGMVAAAFAVTQMLSLAMAAAPVGIMIGWEFGLVPDIVIFLLAAITGIVAAIFIARGVTN